MTATSIEQTKNDQEKPRIYRAETTRTIDLINRRNQISEMTISLFAGALVFAIVAAFLWLIGFGFIQLASEISSWDVSQFQRLAVGY